MNAAIIILCSMLVAVNAGVVYNSVPVVHHAVPVVHAVHTPVITKIVPAAHSSSYSYRAPAAVPVVHHAVPLAVHSVHPVVHHTPVIAAAHPILLH